MDRGAKYTVEALNYQILRTVDGGIISASHAIVVLSKFTGNWKSISMLLIDISMIGVSQR